jgi:signal transduction histidine kinase
LLDEAGLQSAIQWYIDGFSQRSGIKLTLDLPTRLDRFDSEIETTLFRAVQEGLTNVHRHSYASQATIRVVVGSKYIRLEVSDNGKGMRKDRLRNVLESGGEAGVGLAGMRERVRDLGGSLSIKSDKKGTMLGISIPVKAESEVVDEDGDGQRLSTA